MKLEKNKTPFTWGLTEINQKLGRPDRQELIVLMGYPGTGKTEFTHFVARANADLGVKVAYLSLEMPSNALAQRYAQKRAGVRYIDRQEGNYTEEQGRIMAEEKEHFIKYKNIHMIGEEKRYTLKELIGQYPEGKNRGILDFLYHEGCRMFIIDNLGKIGGFPHELEAQEKITDALQAWKNKLNVNVILLHHMSKPDKKANKFIPGGLSALRGNQKIIDNASQIIEIHRNQDPEEDNPEEKAAVELFQYKHTMAGENGFCKIYFSKSVYTEQYDGPVGKYSKQNTPAKKKKEDDGIIVTDNDKDDLPF